MTVREINQNALRYWMLSGYSKDDIDTVCKEVDGQWTAARITFTDEGVEIAITRRTWEQQSGHYPTVCKFFEGVALHPVMSSVRGSVLVWLEDGMWEAQQKYTAIAPILSFGRHRSDQRSFLIPDPAFMQTVGYFKELSEFTKQAKTLPWGKRKKTIFWRGAATGLSIESPSWVKTPRGALCLLANEINDPEILDAKITKISHLPDERQKEMRQQGVLGEQVDFNDFLKFRYLVDADGYCCAWKSLMLKLASGSVTIKVHSEYEQWFYRELMPWVNYIPLRPDSADLLEIYRWLLAHDSEACKIADNGRQLVEGITFEQSLDDVAHLCAALIAIQKPGEINAGTPQPVASLQP